MPELPEVETLVRSLRPALVGRTILSARVRWARTLANDTPAHFKKQIGGRQVLGLARRAKYFDLQVTGAHLVIHLRMSGDLRLVPADQVPAVHDRLSLDLSGDMKLVFNDARKFGRAWFLPDPASLFARLGPEPLGEDFTPAWLCAALGARRRQIKPLLLDQTFIAGLGNIYTDEALHMAKIHPQTCSQAVSAAQCAALWQAIRAVLQEGIRRNGASIDWVYRGGEFQNYFRVYGRAGQACPACGAAVERIVTGQRGTHFCPVCQPAPA